VGVDIAEGKCWESGSRSRGQPSRESESWIFVSLVLRSMKAVRGGWGAIVVVELRGERIFGVRLERTERLYTVNCTRNSLQYYLQQLRNKQVFIRGTPRDCRSTNIDLSVTHKARKFVEY